MSDGMMRTLLIGLYATTTVLLIHRYRGYKKLECFVFGKKKKTKKKVVKAGSVEYYRLYKYMYMQQMVGITPFETLRRLYLITEHATLRSLLYDMSVAITHSNEVETGVAMLKERLRGEDSLLFISIVENSIKTGFAGTSMRQLDELLFQKYLVDIRRRVKKGKRRYFRAAFLFCTAVFLAIMIPVVHQMMRSIDMIFVGY